jgi:hypothetical protein
MQSINIYDLKNQEFNPENEVRAFENEEQQFINDFNEKLRTFLIENNVTPNCYKNFMVVTDKVYNQTVRVKGEVVRQVIMQESYQAYYRENAQSKPIGALVTLCKTEDAEKVKGILESQFNLQFDQHTFDILRIIQSASDVRKANFKVKIETVNSVSMGGTRVDCTEYYSRMLQQGNLRAVIITYDMPNQTVTLRISVEGNILLYNQIDNTEVLDLVEQLLAI